MTPLTMTFTDRLIVTTCWCGINHAVPQDLYDYQQRQHRDAGKVPNIYCPLGHIHVPAGKPEVERVQASLERERNRAARLAAERDQAQASARGHKAAATRARKRAAAAVCPCCKRSFVQLRRHLENKHPDYDPETSHAA